LKIKYLSGYPRSYRFDASRGTFNENGETVLTKKGEPFTFAPIAYRKFRDDIMGFGAKNWIEFFFLNESLQVCALMFFQKNHCIPYGLELFFWRKWRKNRPSKTIFNIDQLLTSN
jgi:hypothetical protein